MDCIHHWKLASPNGPTVHGICKRCDAERDFPTSSDAVIWTDRSTKAPRAEVLQPGTEIAAEIIRILWQ